MVELLRQNRKAGVTPFAMNKITQEMQLRQAVIEYSLKYGATKAAICYKTNCQYTKSKKLTSSDISLHKKRLTDTHKFNDYYGTETPQNPKKAEKPL